MSKHVATFVKLIRLANGITQEKLAEVIKRTPGHVGMLEQGRALPSYEVMEKLVKKYKLDANLFFDDAWLDAQAIDAGFANVVKNMPDEVREQFRNYIYAVDWFSKADSDPNKNNGK